ncbi:hypothetical protein WA026_009732 [Henosepilachna vigintioctopunctata]|uniref:Tetratricopeptide repeat protein n=1 Tax=Henosepilachna vigintioctopunctata TaxID=420089 RepID=A0AAW1TRM2_9CUCU
MPLEKPDIFNALSVYREIGIKLGGLEKFEKSLDYFDSALRRNPKDSRSLRGRAEYSAKANKYDDALEDIETLKQIDPDNIYVSAYESLVKYLCSEYEQAMVLNLRKQILRKNPIIS